MGSTPGIEGCQAIRTLNNDIRGSAGSNSSSFYISSSGVKSILSNAWNAIKSAFSNVLSVFGNHLSGQQGSEKIGREITMDIASRPAQPLLDMDAQLENSIYESSSEDIYDSVYEYIGSGRPESLYSSIDESLYSEIDGSLYEKTSKDQVPPPVPLSTHPLFSRSFGSESEPEVMDSGEHIYSEPYSTPENDPRGNSDYDAPWQSYSGK